MKAPCPRCGKTNNPSGMGYAILLNPFTWLIANPVEAARYCKECAALLTLFGMIFGLTGAAVIFLLAAIFI